MKLSLRHQFAAAVAPLALLLIALVIALLVDVFPVQTAVKKMERDLAKTVDAEDVSESLSEEVIAKIVGRGSDECEETIAYLTNWGALADDPQEKQSLADLRRQILLLDASSEQRESGADDKRPETSQVRISEWMTLFDRSQVIVGLAESRNHFDIENTIATVGKGIPIFLRSSRLQSELDKLQYHVRMTRIATTFLRSVLAERLAYQWATLPHEKTSLIQDRIYSARTVGADAFRSLKETAVHHSGGGDENFDKLHEIVREYERFGQLGQRLESELLATGRLEPRSVQGLEGLSELADQYVAGEHQKARERAKDVERSTQVLFAALTVVSGVVIALAVGLPLIFGRRLIRALVSFESSAREVREGKFSGRVNVQSNDELGQAANSFNAMAEDLQRAAAARAKSDERFHRAASATHDVIWDWDLISGEIWINEESKHLLGLDALDNVPLTAWYDAIHPDDVERFRGGILKALDTGAATWTDQYRFRRPDGSYAFVLDRASIVRAADGHPARLIGAMVDISEQKKAQIAIADLNREQELLLNSVADGILGFDLGGKINVVNPAAALALGAELTELRGEQVHALLHGVDSTHDWLTCSFRAALASAQTQRSDEDSFRRLHGNRFAAEHVCSAIQDENGSVQGAVLTFRDVSERTVLQRMKAEFVSTVSHELRTPLTSIRGSLGLLASGVLGNTSERGQRMLDIAISNTDRLVRLINDILDIERLDSGRGVLTRKRLNSGELIEQAVEVMKSMAEKAEVTLELDATALPVYGDSDRLMQMLTNLISNAIKFSPAGGVVAVRAEADKGMLRFEVSDHGRGIPADKLSLIFERFQQVDASDSRDKGGTGLGLAICRSIVQQHGGRIWAESVLGAGSTFYFTIPLNISGLSDDSPHDLSPVLICDDDPSVREVLAHILRARGYAVVTAASGEEAIALASDRRPRAIILDLMMEGMSGWETMAALRELPFTHDVPILIASVLTPAEANAVSGLDVEAVDGWIQKPFDEQLLLESLERIADEGGTPKVLVIEDDGDLAQTLITSLGRFGLIVDHARNGREAVQIALDVKPSLIILDVGLPELDGFSVVQALRNDETLCHVPVVVYSGAEIAPGQRRSLELGPTEFLVKSRITPKAFEQKVMGLLGILAAEKESPYVEAHSARG